MSYVGVLEIKLPTALDTIAKREYLNELINSRVELMSIVHCFLISIGVHNLQRNSRSVARFEFRGLDCKRLLVCKLFQLVKFRFVCRRGILLIKEAHFSVCGKKHDLGSIRHILGGYFLRTLTLDIHNRQSKVMVRLREVRESYLIVLDTFLRESPTWTVIIAVVRHRYRFKTVQLLLFKLITANLEQVLDFDDGVLNLVLALNLLDKAVVIGVIPYLYVILCLVAIRTEV